MTKSENDRRIDYIEMNVADIERSKAFYGKAFGWSFGGRRFHFLDPDGYELAVWSKNA
jgi:predicted enzyme related to lactoylglutathione lyase